MSQDHSHLTTEQLSAFLDQQLTTEEQQQTEAHLQNCEQCRLRLADLRQTVAMLRALPRPQAPRSFTLQTTDAPVTPIAILPAERSTDAAPRPIAARRTGWPRAVRTTTRIISTLAAVIGIFFLLSSLLASVPLHGGATGTAASNNTSSGSAPQAASHTSQGSATNQAKRLTPAIAPTVTPTPTLTSAARADTPVTNPPATINLSQPGIQALLGLALLVLSIIGFILLRIQRPRAP